MARCREPLVVRVGANEKPSRNWPRSGTSVRTAEPAANREDTKKKVIDRIKGIAPSLLASGAIVNARKSPLESPAKPRRLRRPAEKK